jgi:hypothetical protein
MPYVIAIVVAVFILPRACESDARPTDARRSHYAPAEEREELVGRVKKVAEKRMRGAHLDVPVLRCLEVGAEDPAEVLPLVVGRQDGGEPFDAEAGA